jgi:transposase
MAFIGADVNRWSPHAEVERPEPILTPLKPDGTLIAVIEMSPSSWLVAGIVPGVERQPSKKLEVDENALLKLLNRWREEAHKAGQGIERIAVAFEAGRDGFWLARGLRTPEGEPIPPNTNGAPAARQRSDTADRGRSRGASQANAH